MSLRIACDLDGTIADMDAALQRELRRLFGPDVDLHAAVSRPLESAEDVEGQLAAAAEGRATDNDPTVAAPNAAARRAPRRGPSFAAVERGGQDVRLLALARGDRAGRGGPTGWPGGAPSMGGAVSHAAAPVGRRDDTGAVAALAARARIRVPVCVRDGAARAGAWRRRSRSTW